jgi:MoaA/NifB/PqqE/SkfB family radical SAM enzyme
MARLRVARPLEVALMYSHQCNIACRHCGILSSPHNKARMSLEDARRYIDEAAAIPGFRKVTFTGGEPMMFQKEHIELLERCKRHGLETRMVTNGFWAKNLERGTRLMERLKEAGLSELNFSADKFHLEFQEPSTLRNGLECARRAGFLRIVSFVSNSGIPPLDDFAAMYDLPREDLVDLRQLMQRLETLEALKDEKIFVYYGGLIGLGRAAEYPEELHSVPLTTFPNGVGCPEVINKPVIYPNGDFQACCCAGGKIRTFTVGNMAQMTLQQVFDKMYMRSHWRFINAYGPKDLFDAVAAARPDLPRKREYGSICEVCVAATKGLPAEEVDQIADAESLSRMLMALGVSLERDVAS